MPRSSCKIRHKLVTNPGLPQHEWTLLVKLADTQRTVMDVVWDLDSCYREQGPEGRGNPSQEERPAFMVRGVSEDTDLGYENTAYDGEAGKNNYNAEQCFDDCEEVDQDDAEWVECYEGGAEAQTDEGHVHDKEME